ncbi:MAG: hypothetical protein OHK0029_00320 [Armatimonadaceae bacterium]
MKDWKNYIGISRAIFGALVLTSSLILASCDNNTQTGTNAATTVPGEQIVATPGAGEANNTPVALPKTLVYVVGSNNEGEGQLRPVEVELDPSQPASAVMALNKMAEMKDSPLPQGARARSVRIADGLATVDFSREFADNFEGGDRREALMFNALLATLGQFPDVSRVQILVDGEKVAVGGTQDTTEPLDVPKEYIRTAQNTPQS